MHRFGRFFKGARLARVCLLFSFTHSFCLASKLALYPMKSSLRFAVVLVLGAVVGVAGYQWYVNGHGAALAQSSASPAAAPAKLAAPAGVGVEVAPVTRMPLQRSIAAVGTLRSDNSVMLRPEVAGRIAEINFTEGGKVKKGDVLIRLDDSVPQAQLQQAQANLALAESRHRRAQELSREGFISKQARDEAASELKVQRAAVALAKAQLEKTVIQAPFDGLIGLRNVSVGDYISPGADLVPIESVDPLKVDFRVPEQYLGSVYQGLKLILSFDALPGQTRQGQVGAISPVVDVGGRSILLRATVPNPDDTLRPGMFARVRLQLSNTEALVVPETALAPSGDTQYVFKVEQGVARRVPVTIGLRRQGMVELQDGVQDGDQVIVSGLQKVADGQAVRILDTKKAGN